MRPFKSPAWVQKLNINVVDLLDGANALGRKMNHWGTDDAT